MNCDYLGPYYSLEDLRSVIDAMCKSLESSGQIDEHEHPSAYSTLLDTAKWMAELEGLNAELERERMRLAACGVVAMADTPESAAKAQEMRDEYRSASCDDVARRVDECMTLRAERDALAALVSDLDESSSYWSEYEVPLGIVERIKEAAKTWKGRKQ